MESTDMGNMTINMARQFRSILQGGIPFPPHREILRKSVDILSSHRFGRESDILDMYTYIYIYVYIFIHKCIYICTLHFHLKVHQSSFSQPQDNHPAEAVEKMCQILVVSVFLC